MGLNYQQNRKYFVLLFMTRIVRMFSFGMLAVVFFDMLFYMGLDNYEASWMQAGIVFSSIIKSLIFTTCANCIGKVNALAIASLFMLVTAIIYALTNELYLFALSGMLGFITVTGCEIGPFMSIEQSALSQLIDNCVDNKDQAPKYKYTVLGYYEITGYVSQALGAAFAGIFAELTFKYTELSKMLAMMSVVKIYAVLCCLILILYCCLGRKEIEAPQDKEETTQIGIKPENKNNIRILSVLFGVDGFAGAFIAQSFLAYYYEQKYDLHLDAIGGVVFACIIASCVSRVFSSKLADKISVVSNLIYCRLPSSILLITVGFTNSPTISFILLFAHLSISQKDKPTFVGMMVSNEELTAAERITNVARLIGLGVGLGLNHIFMAHKAKSAQFSYPFIVAGVVKMLYDVGMVCLVEWNQKKKREEGIIEVGSTDLVEAPTSQEDCNYRWNDI